MMYARTDKETCFFFQILLTSFAVKIIAQSCQLTETNVNVFGAYSKQNIVAQTSIRE
jgi:hypothetical protein